MLLAVPVSAVAVLSFVMWAPATAVQRPLTAAIVPVGRITHQIPVDVKEFSATPGAGNLRLRGLSLLQEPALPTGIDKKTPEEIRAMSRDPKHHGLHFLGDPACGM